MSDTDALYEVGRLLIETDTVSHLANASLMENLADRLSQAGFRSKLQRWGEGEAAKANLVAVLGPAETDGLVVSGHLDTVPHADQPGWNRDPVRLGVEDERIYGRGTSDMKGFLAQCMVAAERIDAARLRRPLAFVFTADEEIGCLGAGRLATELPALMDECPLPRLAWIGEPTSDQVCHAHKGVVVFELTVEGEGGHSSLPEAGVNAIAITAGIARVMGELQQERRTRSSPEAQQLFPDAPYTSFNFGKIHGGTASNMIAESCTLLVSYRPLPDEDPRAFYEDARARVEAQGPKDWGSPGREARIRWGAPTVAPGLHSPRGSALEQALFAELRVAESGGVPFCTDGGHLAAVGIDSLVCGPGDLEQAHQPNESISRAAFEGGADNIVRVVERLCGEAS